MNSVKTIQLQPIRTSPQEFDAVEAVIKKLLKKELYLPLLEELGIRSTQVLKNSKDDLLKALQLGKIRYSDGHFRGKFGATQSKELKAMGAVWDVKQGTFKLPESKIKPQVKIAIQYGQQRTERIAQSLQKKLAGVDSEAIASKLDVKKILEKTLNKFDKSFKRSVQSIGIVPHFNEAQQDQIAEEYTNNMRLDIKGWLDDEVKELRGKIEESTRKGLRYENLFKMIEDSYGVSASKAKFLARQETNLLVTKYKEIRYKKAGVNQYKWQCVVGSPKHPVRPLHKKNDQKIFTWDNPPVVAENPIRRENPGEDFNCRCIAIPVVSFREVAA